MGAHHATSNPTGARHEMPSPTVPVTSARVAMTAATLTAATASAVVAGTGVAAADPGDHARVGVDHDGDQVAGWSRDGGDCGCRDGSDTDADADADSGPDDDADSGPDAVFDGVFDGRWDDLRADGGERDVPAPRRGAPHPQERAGGSSHPGPSPTGSTARPTTPTVTGSEARGIDAPPPPGQSRVIKLPSRH